MNWRAVLFLAVGVALAGSCASAEEMAAPKAVAEPAAARDGGYVAAGKRDPFRPFTLDLRPQRTQQGPLTPLQKYEIGQLKVAGTVAGMSPPRAMVEDSVGMGYIVTIGTPIGRNDGVVKAIEPGRIVVEEKVFDFYGREQANTVVLAVPSDEAEERPETEAREQR